MSVKLLTEQDLEFLGLKGGCTGSSESTHVKCHIVGNHMSQLLLSAWPAQKVETPTAENEIFSHYV